MHTILVADDSVTILKAVEIVFDKEPFQVVKAGSGAEAIARARELKPHLVLADHAMGDKSGYEVAEALKADPLTSAIPVLILSGSSQPYDEGRARAAGVAGHVPKPFDCQSLLDRVRTLLGVAATAPGTAVIPAASAIGASAAASNMPRPPGAGLPRAPGAAGIGLPRPPTTGSGATSATPATPATPASAAATPLATASAAATPIVRAPTPQPARGDLDPFGFGNSLQAAAPAPVSTVPRAASTPPISGARDAAASSGSPSGNPFATASAIGAATPAISEPWKAARGAAAFDNASASSSPPSAAAPKTTAPSYVTESEFLEVADLEVSDIPATPSLPPTPIDPRDDAAIRITEKVDIAKLQRLDAEHAMRSKAAEPSVASPSIAAAAERVVERSAPLIAAAQNGVAPSREALSEEARQIVERVAWEVVPELAEVIIREEIARLLKSRA